MPGRNVESIFLLEGCEIEFDGVRKATLQGLRGHELLETRRLMVITAEVDHQIPSSTVYAHPIAVLLNQFV